jgi:MFS transporter, PAT family, beta-lactamase induction signal transducer AmpG
MSAPVPPRDARPAGDANAPGATDAPASGPRRSTTTWVSTTYFAEGLPYQMVRYLAGVYLTDVGVKELYLGFLNFLAIPWNLKFLWAPAVDLYGTKRGWLLKVESLLVVTIALMGLCAFIGPDMIQGAATAATSATAVAALGVRLLLVVLVISAVLAATHDIAIDAYYMEAITDPSEQAEYTGLRVMTYRFAFIFTKSALVALAAWASWGFSFLGSALVLGLLLAFHAVYLPRIERRAAPGPRLSEAVRRYGRAFVSYLDQPRIPLVLLFLVTYKLGDEVLISMHAPFLMRGLGVVKTDLAWMQGILGTATNIIGSLVGAWAIRRFGLRRAIWPLTLGMNLNIWAYVWLAWTRPDPHTAAGLALIAGCLAYELLAAGLGNPVLMVYAMRTCKVEFKAAHFAIATALASIVGTIFGGFGGAVVERLGYVWLFLIAFMASLPSMVCLLFLPLSDEPKPVAPAAAGGAAR